MNKFLTLIFSIFIMSLIIACDGQKKLFVEYPKAVENENPYNYDNTVFVPEKEYIFDYSIIKNIDTLKYKILNDSVFEYVRSNDNSKNIVKYLSIKTLKTKGPIFNDHIDYNQTEILLSHLNKNYEPLKKELTGAIENNINLWVHPFRINAFQILQFAPFPFIKKNEMHLYRWNLKIGKHWKELEDIEWKGNLILKCKYKNKNKNTMASAFGDLPIIETSSYCKSKIGISRLITFYNDALGFVKLVYDLPKNEKIIMTLVKIK